MIYLLEDDGAIRELVAYSLNKTGNVAEGFALPSELYAAIDRRPSSSYLTLCSPRRTASQC